MPDVKTLAEAKRARLLTDDKFVRIREGALLCDYYSTMRKTMTLLRFRVANQGDCAFALPGVACDVRARDGFEFVIAHGFGDRTAIAHSLHHRVLAPSRCVRPMRNPEPLSAAHPTVGFI